MEPQFLAFLSAFAAVCVAWKAAPVFAVWLRARRSSAPIRLLTIWTLYFRNAPLDALVDAYISASAAGVRICLREMAAHARAGGDIRAVVQAYLETLRAGTAVEFARVCEIELDERNW